MATGPCQAGFAGTHHYIYLGGRRERSGKDPFKPFFESRLACMHVILVRLSVLSLIIL